MNVFILDKNMEKPAQMLDNVFLKLLKTVMNLKQ